MAMRIKWTERYNKSLEQIFACSKDYFSRETLIYLNKSIIHYESLLIDNPKLGSLEALTIGREKEYRHIVIKPVFKILYYIEDDSIIMADIWDTRRNPKELLFGMA